MATIASRCWGLSSRIGSDCGHTPVGDNGFATATTMAEEARLDRATMAKRAQRDSGNEPWLKATLQGRRRRRGTLLRWKKNGGSCALEEGE